MHYQRDIRRIQIELSNVCNSQCPGCGRFERDWKKLDEVIKRDDRLDIHNVPLKLKDSINLSKPEHIDLDIIKDLLTSKSLDKLETFELAGTVDDPFAYKHLLELFEHLAEHHPHLKLIMHTNGSIRTPDFFAKLPPIFLKFRTQPRIFFSIDGLEDTNHIYRRQCQWNKIMENAQAFIDAGGKAEWQFIIFPWNKHQVQDAEQMAKQMGFHSFKTREDRSELTNLHNNYWPNVTWEKWKNMNKTTFKVDPEQQPVDPNDRITCSYLPLNAYVIEFNGSVWPCCYFSSSRAQKTSQEHHDAPFKQYGDNWNNLNYNSFDEIIEHRFYTEDLVDSWSSTKHGYGLKERIFRCTSTCSKSKDFDNASNKLQEKRFE